MVEIKNIVLGIAIFFLTLSVGIYGINTFYQKAPNYNDYVPNVITYEQCLNVSGSWTNNTVISPDSPGKSIPAKSGYCQYDSNKYQKEYDDAREQYSRGIFFIALPLGIIVIAIGAIVFGLASVGGGLMAGGVGILFYGVVEYWQFAKDYLKFSLSLLGLIILIILTYYINKKWNFGNKKEKSKK